MRVTESEQQILKLFEDGDRALIAADIAELSCIFADDYVQYDESGKSSTKQDVINSLNSGAIRYLSMVSTETERPMADCRITTREIQLKKRKLRNVLSNI